MIARCANVLQSLKAIKRRYTVVFDLSHYGVTIGAKLYEQTNNLDIQKLIDCQVKCAALVKNSHRQRFASIIDLCLI